MARDDWDIRGIEYCTFRNDDEELESCDVYVWSSLFGAIRVREVENLLNLSRQRFVDLLNEPYEMPDGSKNKRHLITNEEEAFRAHERLQIKEPYFTMKKIFANNNVTVSLMDLECWLDDNYNLLKCNNIKVSECNVVDNVKNEDEWLTAYPICERIKTWYEEGKSKEEMATAFVDNAILTKFQSEVIALVNESDIDSDNYWLNVYPVCLSIKNLYEEGMDRNGILVNLINLYNFTNIQAGALIKKDLHWQSDDALKKFVKRLKTTS